jgi:hypothetical protein
VTTPPPPPFEQICSPHSAEAIRPGVSSAYPIFCPLQYFPTLAVPTTEAWPARMIDPGEYLCQPIYGQAGRFGDYMMEAFDFILRIVAGPSRGEFIEVPLWKSDTSSLRRSRGTVVNLGMPPDVLNKQVMFWGGLAVASVKFSYKARAWRGGCNYIVTALRPVLSRADIPADVRNEAIKVEAWKSLCRGPLTSSGRGSSSP